jgi:general L-amino acid transport system permease protein
VILAVAVFVVRSRYQERTGRPGYSVWLASGVFALFALGGWFLAPERPLIPDMPTLQGLNFKGGFSVTAQFATLVTGLGVYTAFIAEVVRAGILAVPKGKRKPRFGGQRRAWCCDWSSAAGAARDHPPLTNQYLNSPRIGLGVAIRLPGTVRRQDDLEPDRQAVEMIR